MGIFNKKSTGPKPVETVDDPPVGFLSHADALMLAAIVQQELNVAREWADEAPVWLAQAQALERILPVIQGSEIIVIE